MNFKKVYRVMRAVDYNGQRERELFYTENEEDARNQYQLAKAKVEQFARENGLQTFNNGCANDKYITFFAQGHTEGRPYTGAKAEFQTEEFCRENFLDFGKDPIF